MWWVQQLLSADKGDRREAWYEVLVTTAASLTPLLLATVVNYSIRYGDNAVSPDIIGIASSSISSGQLLFFVAALIGNIAWLSSRDVNSGHFPPRPFFVLYCLITAGLVGTVIGLDPTLSKLQIPFIFWISVILYIFSLAIYYALLLLNRALPPRMDATLRQGAKDIEQGLVKND